MTDAMLSRRDRRHDHTILPPGWTACHNLDDAGGEPIGVPICDAWS